MLANVRCEYSLLENARYSIQLKFIFIIVCSISHIRSIEKPRKRNLIRISLDFISLSWFRTHYLIFVFIYYYTSRVQRVLLPFVVLCKAVDAHATKIQRFNVCYCCTRIQMILFSRPTHTKHRPIVM